MSFSHILCSLSTTSNAFLMTLSTALNSQSFSCRCYVASIVNNHGMFVISYNSFDWNSLQDYQFGVRDGSHSDLQSRIMETFHSKVMFSCHRYTLRRLVNPRVCFQRQFCNSLEAFAKFLQSLNITNSSSTLAYWFKGAQLMSILQEVNLYFFWNKSNLNSLEDISHSMIL